MMKNTSSNIFLENIEKEIVHLYPNIVQSLQEGLGITDLDENFIFCNRAACRILGYSKNELLGMNLKDLIPSSQLESIRRENEIRKKGSSSRYDLVIHRKNGRLIHVFISAVPFKNRGGEIIGSFGLFRDITAQKKNRGNHQKKCRLLGSPNPERQRRHCIAGHDQQHRGMEYGRRADFQVQPKGSVG
ncbi:MAG: PAS domain-containing protein [Acidobacteria bacterium]|nr:PAS domain-containing protein [Acidobacteriota bacterium]